MEDDTVKLLRECDAGIKMGVATIDQVLEYVKDEKLVRVLSECKEEHEKMKKEIQVLLEKVHDDGKEPSMMAKGMSWVKTNVMLVMKESDATIADLITDGCNMGVKSLKQYLNQYQAADGKAKGIAKKLIDSEERLVKGMDEFL